MDREEVKQIEKNINSILHRIEDKIDKMDNKFDITNERSLHNENNIKHILEDIKDMKTTHKEDMDIVHEVLRQCRLDSNSERNELKKVIEKEAKQVAGSEVGKLELRFKTQLTIVLVSLLTGAGSIILHFVLN